MNAAELIPVPDTIPVGWGWFQILLIATFVLHLLFMNAMLGGSIIALVANLRGTERSLPLARDAASKIPFSVALAVNAGVAPLLFLQVLYGHFVYTSSILMARYWLAVILLLIIAYYSLYLFYFKFDAWERGRTAAIAVAAVLLLAIGFLFTNNWTLALSPTRWSDYFVRPGGVLLNLSEPTLWPRYLHFVVGAIAVGGLFIAVLWERRARRGMPEAAQQVATGLRWFTHATLLQIGLGSWWLIALRSDVRKLFMGGSPVATMLLGVGTVLALLALVAGFRRRVWPAVWLTVATIVVMALMRDIVRTGYLAEFFHPSHLEVVPQYSPLILFLAAVVVGIFAVAVMLRLAIRAGGKA
jgi:hypothetical protein